MTQGKFEHIAVLVSIIQTSEIILANSHITPATVCLFLISTKVQIIRTITQIVSTPAVEVLAFVLTLFIGHESTYTVVTKGTLVIQFQVESLGHIVIMILT